jgi:hypothetical protein
MRVVLTISNICLLMLVLGQSGCEQTAGVAAPPAKVDTGPDVSAYSDYAPAKIHITPLTGIVGSADAQGSSKIDIYVSLLDSFGSQVKSPGVFRFELYEYAQRSAEPKGRRIAIWPDIDLTISADNNHYWQDFLRLYEFNLPLELQGDQNYVLQMTFLSVGGKRLSDEIVLKHTK